MDKKIYIDFDGVILDTISESYKWLAEKNIDYKDIEKTKKFFRELNWEVLINRSSPINNSLEDIRLLMKNGYDVNILTHVQTEAEIEAKNIFISEFIGSITTHYCPKHIEKCDFVDPTNSFLIDDFSKNLLHWEDKGGISIKFAINEEDDKYRVIDKLSKIEHIISDYV